MPLFGAIILLIMEDLKPKVDNGTPKYDLCVITCDGEGKLTIQLIERTNVVIFDEQAKKDNSLVDTKHRGMSRLWMKSGSVKKGQVISYKTVGKAPNETIEIEGQETKSEDKPVVETPIEEGLDS